MKNSCSALSLFSYWFLSSAQYFNGSDGGVLLQLWLFLQFYLLHFIMWVILEKFFILKTFLLRTIAGLFLGIVYIFRGFGITALAHMSYDFIVVSIITTA